MVTNNTQRQSPSKATIFINRGKPQTEIESIEVLFNPSQYTIASGNSFKMQPIIGHATPIAQFINGENKTLSMELFFDTYASGSDVREYTSQITALQDIDSDLGVPPLCTFVWGKVKFEGVLVSVNENYTMFLASGIPVRATLAVTFKEAVGVYKKQTVEKSKSTDTTKTKITKEKERIDAIASEELNDPNEWRGIASANNIDNPRNIPAGTALTIPRSD